MARPPTEGLQDDIRVLLHSYPKGLSIEEISNHLTVSRTTTAKYLNAMEQTGQIESRPYGPAKVYTLTERIPVENIVSLLPHLILVLDESLRVRQANDALLDFFQLDKTELVGHEIQYSPLGSYMNESRLNDLHQVVQGAPRFIEEDITRDGITTYFTIRLIPALFEHGKKGVVLIFEDITALKLAQTHLEELVRERTNELEKVNKKLCDENAKYRKVRDELAVKEKLYERLVESSTDLILKFSSDGVLIYGNPAATTTLGLHPSPGAAYHLKGTCIPDIPDYQEFADTLISSLRNDTSLILKREISYQDQNPLWITWSFRAISSSSGGTEILCVGTDITERVLSERLVVESEHTFSNIISHLPDPTFVISPERRILVWNKAMEEMTGVNAVNVIMKERSLFTSSIYGYTRPILADLIFDPNNSEIKKHFHNLYQEEGMISAETKGIGKMGEEVIFWVNVTPLKDRDGHIIGAIQSMRDITPLKSLESSLMQSEGLMRGIIDASKDLIVVLDESKKYIIVNSAYERIFQCNSTELEGKSIAEIPLPGDANLWTRSIDTLIQTRLSNRIEMTYVRDSHEHWLDCYLVPFFPMPSEKLHILLEIRDISGLKGGDQALWGEETALQEINKQVSQLIPTLNLRSWIAPLPLFMIILFACTGNFI